MSFETHFEPIAIVFILEGLREFVPGAWKMIGDTSMAVEYWWCLSDRHRQGRELSEKSDLY